tara:strand:+ start:1108 stop:1812 length:705 start_codon:yes stop_codon:yes gene_type:complete
MKSGGYYKMHRGWMDNPVLKDNDERIVWLSIIERAAWADTETYINGQLLKVSRGCFFTSLRHICIHVHWDVKKVSRFLKRLESCHMIVTEVTSGLTHVTVCNYEEYQSNGHRSDTPDAQKLTHKEEINNKERNNIAGWDEFWTAYPSGMMENGKPRRWPKAGRSSAHGAYATAIKSGATIDQLLTAAKNYGAEKSDGQFVYNPKKFLSEGHWENWLEVKDTSDTAVFKKDWDSF